MDHQRQRRGRPTGARRSGGALRERATALAGRAGFTTDFRGYEATEARDDRRCRRRGDATAACSSSSSSRRSTRPAAGRCTTRAWSSALTATVWRGSTTCSASATTRSWRSCPNVGAGARKPRPRPRRLERAARDGVQPHRHPPAARSAAGAARAARAPGRLLRRPRQAALRLHPRLGAVGGRRRVRRGRGQRLDRRRLPGAGADDDADEAKAPARWPCSARSTARSSG